MKEISMSNSAMVKPEQKILITAVFENGMTYRVNVTEAAWDRAKYYTDVDHNAGDFPASQYQDRLQAEFDYTISEEGHDDLLDWLSNNTDWSEVSDNATRIMKDDPATDYNSQWVNAEKTIWTPENANG